jgi:hypothetical protein
MCPPIDLYWFLSMVNSKGATIAGVGTYPKELSGISKTSTISVIPPPGQIYVFAPPQVILVVLFLTDLVN